MSTQNENQTENQTEKNTATRRKGKLIFFGITTFAIMVFIFVQSAMPDVVSAEESNLIVEFIRNIMEKASIPVFNMEMLSYIVRKGAHFSEYAAFGLSLYALGRALAGLRKGKKDAGSEQEQFGGKEKKAFAPDPALISWAAGTLYAITDEIHQLFVPGRFGQVSDIIIDSMGVATGILLLYIISETNKKRVKKLWKKTKKSRLKRPIL